MKTEDMISFFMMMKDKTSEIKSIVEDFESFAEHLAQIAPHLTEIAKIGRSVIKKAEEVKK